MYDLYCPLIEGVSGRTPIEEAKKTVYDALAPLGEDYRKVLQQGFDNRWIDVYENAGKRSGAYSAGARVHPYVLLNYTGTLDSQFTLALDADYVIFVAEVASTCNEALLMEYLLGKTTDKKERAYLINHFLEQFRTTLYRQTMFAEFELNVGRMAQEGTSLTPEVLNAEYRRLNRLYFGENIVLDHEIDTEWMRIPHFYYNYYVFQYATGYAAAIALSRRILREGAPAVKDYIGFLSGGCSKSPIDLLKGAGVDMSTTKPVEEALSLFGELIGEMEELPTLHTFENNNIFTGSCGLLRFRIAPTVVMATPKEVDLAASSIHAELWHDELCYELSEMEQERTFPMSDEGRAAMQQWLEENIEPKAI